MKSKFTGSLKNLIKAYDKSDQVDYDSGVRSYPCYNLIMQRLTEKFGCTMAQATAVFVSLSPNNDYLNNVRSAVTLLAGKKAGISVDRLTVSTYGHCKERAWHYLHCHDDEFLRLTKGPKIRAFYQNILDPTNPEHVTVDGHMVSCWHGKRLNMRQAVVSGFSYKVIADDIKTLAQEHGLVPCQMQGVLWFTWKRINRVVYNNNLDLFGDHWGLDRDPREMHGFPLRVNP